MTHTQKQEWHNSGSSCCTPFGTCMLSWWCPCILYGKTRHRVKSNGNMEGYSCCNTSCAAFTGLACLGVSFILPMIARGDIRAKYNLAGGGCKDCLCACCCQPCDLTQQDKEAEWWGNNKAGQLLQYKAENQMEFKKQQPQHQHQQSQHQHQYQQPQQQPQQQPPPRVGNNQSINF